MTKAKIFETILTITAGLLVFYLIFRIDALLYSAIGVAIAGLFSRLLGGIITKLWLKLAEYLGMISSPILLSIVYYLLLTPIALLYRLFNRSKSMLKKPKLPGCYFERNHHYIPDDFENPW